MPVISPDPGQLHKEQVALDKKQREDEERSKYLSDLKASRKFHKYVLDEIFNAELESTYNLDNVPISDDPIKMGNLTLQYKLARAGVKKIIDKFK